MPFFTGYEAFLLDNLIGAPGPSPMPSPMPNPIPILSLTCPYPYPYPYPITRYADHKYADILKGIYALMSPTDRKALPAEQVGLRVSVERVPL